MIDAPPIWSLLFDHLQAGASKRAQSGGLGVGQSLVANVVVGRLIDAFRRWRAPPRYMILRRSCAIEFSALPGWPWSAPWGFPSAGFLRVKRWMPRSIRRVRYWSDRVWYLT